MKTGSLQRSLLLLLALLAFIAFLRLGFWQLDRARYKDSLTEALDTARSHEPERVATITELAGLERYFPVRVEGRFDRHTLLLDNRIRDGRVGVEVISPLRLSDAGGWLLVNRGWLPLPPDRTLPEIETPEEVLVIEGMLDHWPAVGVQMGNYPELGQYPVILVPWLDQARVEGMLGDMVSERMLLLSPESAFGYSRDWQIRSMPGSRHRGYAVQWFGLAAALVVITLILMLRNLRRPNHE